jgi:hypothetical protein
MLYYRVISNQFNSGIRLEVGYHLHTNSVTYCAKFVLEIKSERSFKITKSNAAICL